jgi:hypothetical protein
MKMEQGTVVREDVSADHEFVAETHEILWQALESSKPQI